MAVLDAGRAGRYVPGRHSGAARAYFTKIIPAEQSGEYFGLLDICGKGAAFLGTTIVSSVTQLTNNMSLGVGMIAILFVIGFILFRMAAKADAVVRK